VTQVRTKYWPDHWRYGLLQEVHGPQLRGRGRSVRLYLAAARLKDRPRSEPPARVLGILGILGPWTG